MNLRYAFFAFALISSPAFAEPVVSLDWNACHGPINVASQPGQPISLYASVIGQSEGHKAFQVRILLRPNGSVLPDAWRFDANGCQSLARLGFNHYSNDPNCPQFHGDEPQVEIPDFAFEPALNRWRFVYAVAYPFGIPTADPNVRYTMVRLIMDHTFSTEAPTVPGETCGGFFEPMCFYLYKAEWVDMAIVEHTYNVNQWFLTVNDPNGIACYSVAVPARAATWGAIKNTYRN